MCVNINKMLSQNCYTKVLVYLLNLNENYIFIICNKISYFCYCVIIYIFVHFQAADAGISSKKYREFAKSQINYMLGDSGRSYVVGYGVNPPQQPHHAAR